MTTRKAMDEFMAKAEQAISFAEEQYIAYSKQEHLNDDEYTMALQQLELLHKELTPVHNSANDQQREDLRRMRMRFEELQHKMITHKPWKEA
ncbi:MAG: hypothetical protein K0R71_1313 [Bacillales bacterium]|jgi:hypothetical protein|nr:hypothetical protein [Bacillales bacterium]